MEGLELTKPVKICHSHFENQRGSVLEINTHFPHASSNLISTYLTPPKKPQTHVHINAYAQIFIMVKPRKKLQVINTQTDGQIVILNSVKGCLAIEYQQGNCRQTQKHACW